MADYTGRWKTVLVEIEEGIAWVTFNRPEKRNAMSPTLNSEMCEILLALELDADAGDPRRTDVHLGAMVSAEAARRVAGMIEDAVGKGAHIVTGGQVEGAVMQATVLDHVTPEMKLYRDESFGPVVFVIRVADEEEAIRVANDSAFGLSAAVFTRDTARGLRVAERMESGICHINGSTVHDEANMPFGGVKDSGYGRFGGTAAIAEFTDLRWITLQTEPRHYPI